MREVEQLMPPKNPKPTYPKPGSESEPESKPESKSEPRQALEVTPEGESVVLVKKYMEVSQGKLISVLTLFDDYRIWRSWDGRWRWVFGNWFDDDFGLQSHGARRTLRGAVRAIIENRNLRREIYGPDPKKPK